MIFTLHELLAERARFLAIQRNIDATNNIVLPYHGELVILSAIPFLK